MVFTDQCSTPFLFNIVSPDEQTTTIPRRRKKCDICRIINTLRRDLIAYYNETIPKSAKTKMNPIDLVVRAISHAEFKTPEIASATLALLGEVRRDLVVVEYEHSVDTEDKMETLTKAIDVYLSSPFEDEEEVEESDESDEDEEVDYDEEDDDDDDDNDDVDNEDEEDADLDLDDDEDIDDVDEGDEDDGEGEETKLV